MRHAILGAGGVGGLVAAAPARGGASVVILLNPDAVRGAKQWIEAPATGDGLA